MTAPRVSVVIPVRDEEATISRCLDALTAQDFPHDQVEVLVVDGGSTDRTALVAARHLQGGGWLRTEVLNNAAGDRPSNLNRGLAEASAPYLCRVDARSRIPAHYLRTCVELLDARADLAVVGGRQRAWSERGALAAGIARALNNRWGTGFARYRRGTTSGVADTVYLGTFRTDQLHACGGWSGRLPVNEDFDLNRRLRHFGKVWFESTLTVDYEARSALRAVARQYWAFGTAKARYWRVTGDRPRPRQVALLVAPPLAVLTAAALWLLLGPGVIVPLLVATAVLAVAVEVFGTDGPPATVTAHLVGVLALGTVVASWLGGVCAGLLRRGRTPAEVGTRVTVAG